MNDAHAGTLPEDHGYLWLMVTPPTIWAAHFLSSYVLTSVWCARFAGRDGVASGARTVVMWLTLAALASIAVVGWGAYRRHTRGGRHGPQDRDTAEARHRFLGHATFLLAGLSALATIFTALAASFFDTCN
jgi:hypothetical protein